MNGLAKFLVDSILNEDENALGSVALFGGGFKPPTKGHLDVVLQGLRDNPEVKQVYILVGSGVRNGVTQEEAVKIWKIYKKFIPVSTQIVAVQSPFSYIKTYLQDHQDENVYIFIGARPDNDEDEKDVAERSAYAKKYSEKAFPVKVTTPGNVSGTQARAAAITSKEDFLQFIPSKLTDSEKESIYQMVADVVKEKINENASYSSDINVKEKILELTKHMLAKGMNIKPLPKVKFVNGDSNNAREFLGKTAYYDPNNFTITLYTEGRHPKDIVRSFSHEMIHHIQNLEDRLGDVSTTNTMEDDNIDKLEQEANLKGTMTFRNWTDSLNENTTTNSYPFKVTDKTYDDEDNSLITVSYELTTPDNSYRVEFYSGEYRPEAKTFDLSFGVNTGDLNTIDTFQMTGEGNARKIFKTILNIVEDFINKEDVEKIVVDGTDEKRKRIYKAIFSSTPPNISDKIELKEAKNKDPFGLNQYARELAKGLEEAIVGKKVECDNCDWSWNIKDGGDDLYTCHKCGHDNTPQLNEGRYDSLVRQLASITLNSWKDDSKGGEKNGYFTDEITPENYPTDLNFVFKASAQFTDNKPYDHNGYSRPDGEVGVKYIIPKDMVPQGWEEIYMDLVSTIRHEIEHQTQSGKNVKDGKGMESDAILRKLIRTGGDVVRYVTLPKEVDANVNGLYLKAKKWKRPYAEVVDEYIKDFIGIDNPADASYIKNIFAKRAKELNLPNILTEGRYDKSTNQFSNIVFDMFKSIHDRGDKTGEFEFSVGPDDEDIYSEQFEFDLAGVVEITDDEYEVNGGANAGFDNKGDEVIPLLSVRFKIPKNPDWQRVSFDIKDVVRHELEHLTQDGLNVKSGKQMADDQMFRNMIDMDLLPKADYFKLEKEIDAMLQGLYLKAKKSRRPYKEVIDDYLSTQPITAEDKEEILNLWKSRGKALSLPLFEQENMGKDYKIYLDMDGVIVDFDKRFTDLAGMGPREYENSFGKEKFWDFIDSKEKGGGVGFWVGMPWMPGGEALYNRVAQHNHALLSSPSRSESSKLGKRLWKKKYTPTTDLILSLAANKKNYANGDSILIDDRESNIQQWREAGGIGILYKSPSQVNQELDKLGL
jgi:phosphopantetheine adenylyltransferase